MSRFSSSVGSLLGVTGLLVLGCDSGSTSADSSGGATSSGGAAVAGATSASAGATNNGGALGHAGSSSVAGAAGTATGGGSGAPAAGGVGGSGTGGSGGVPAGGCAGALICDDFESYTGTPGAPWKIVKNSGTVSIDSAQHHSGTKAVKFATTGAVAYQQAFISLESVFPIAKNAFYGRMMIYTAKAPNDGVHWTMIAGEGAGTASGITKADVRYGGQQMQRLMANYDTAGAASDCYQHSATQMPEGNWACMEWYFDGATNTQKFWLDGKAIDDLTVVGQGEGCVNQGTGGKWLYPAFERVNLGWESYQKDDAREVWIDDVAIGVTQIGCPK